MSIHVQGIPSSHGFDSHGLATHEFFRALVKMAGAALELKFHDAESIKVTKI